MRKRTTWGSALMLVMLAIAATFNITFYVASEYYRARLGDFDQLESEYKDFKEVANLVDKYFVGEYDKQTMMEGALKGYIQGTGDQWSSYLTEEEYQDLLARRERVYAGVGITISAGMEDSYYVITAVTEDSPAEKAGIQVLDLLAAVDGQSVAEMTYDDLTQRVKGEPGTDVELTILREGERQKLTLTREEVQTPGVKAQMLEGDIGLVRIESFSRNVDGEFEQKLQGLLDEGARAIVFDVRFNPGGFVDVLVNMLDLLLPKGAIISITDKEGQSTTYSSGESCIQLPMAVLCNEYSISASEFFAASLQEYGAATVVGGHTTGKGYAQTLIPLSGGGAVNLSTSRYYTAKGTSLAGVGIAPDVEAELSEQKLADFYTLTPEEDDQLQAALKTLEKQMTD